jgi:hypothetical protein
MLRLKLLYSKPFFKRNCGDTVVDLTRRSVSFLDVRSNSGQPFLVSDDYIMRPDLIANQFYGSSDKVDLLLKYNGYSNPFSVGPEAVLLVPDAETLSKFSATPPDLKLDQPRKKKANVKFTPTAKKDKRRLDFLTKKGGATAPPVAPNVALDKGVKIQNGQIVFGSDVTSVKKDDCPEPISRTKLIQSLIQNKIGG